LVVFGKVVFVTKNNQTLSKNTTKNIFGGFGI